MKITWLRSRLDEALIAGLGLALLTSSKAFGQNGAGPSEWQAEKCRAYGSAWQQALEAFGSDQLNYNFIAQNENFIASGCTVPASACPQSRQEIEIADALTITMMNAGSASTFMPFRCELQDDPAVSPGSVASDALLCRSQVDLLLSGGKLTESEVAVFEAQCACLEQQSDHTECTSPWTN